MQSFNQKKKKKTIKQKQSTPETTTSQTKTVRCDCLNLSDNPDKFIGKRVIVNLGYLSSLNGLIGLRKLSDDNYERLLSTETFDIFDEDDIYNTRVADCSGGDNFYLRIPKNIHGNLPNLTSGYITVVGVLKNRNTIIVESIRR